MSPPADAVGSAALRGARPAVTAHPEIAASTAYLGKPYAVPVREVVGSSGWFAEAAYRGFEVLVALIGLIAALPVIFVAAILIRCDSPGPALFFHKRPARSTMMRGRDLEGRTDLRPPPGGYRPDAWYHVPSYFTLVKLRTMHCDARSRF